jgi:predicted N-acyltransferase
MGVQIQILSSIQQISATEWDGLFASDYPFVHHAFLAALEASGCVAPDIGWTPHHLIARDADGALLAAMPAYLKDNSWGEFVFDWQWAEASQRLGQPYYPKLLCAMPYTPATGPRIAARDAAARDNIVTAYRDLALDQGRSSAHALFLDATDGDAFEAAGFARRNDVQFQFHNPGYADFEDFLSRLSSAKRKKIRRERRRVAEVGVRYSVVAGDALSESQWDRVYLLYAHTYAERGQAPYLSREFWRQWGAAAGTPVRVIVGEENGEIIACALCVEGGDTLYGRHWGALASHHSLHFETCYYQGIEYCIARGLRRYDAGTQGGHKLARGFDPVITRSAHWLAEPRLDAAVRHYLARERTAVAEGREILNEHSAFRIDNNAAAHDPGGRPLS